MKERIKSTPYFSAYSLNALNLTTSQATVANRKSRISRVINGLKVLPLSEKKVSINRINIPLTVQSAENNWFNNYE
ncbi:MAG TPA: hypothetical protein VK588_07425 [Chitinophagaceae bacterium]|nr:hypothetical protein [Chitinophagaceae bacterium]